MSRLTERQKSDKIITIIRNGKKLIDKGKITKEGKKQLSGKK